MSLVSKWVFSLLDIFKNRVPAIKLQSAMFEALGPPGLALMKELSKKAKDEGLLVILDAKRGDIGSTMAAYGRFAFDYIGADALTVTPYLGFDVLHGLKPWLNDGKGAYVVLRSSNCAGKRLQDIESESKICFYQSVLADFTRQSIESGLKADTWGIVLGATGLEELTPLQRSELASFHLLLPGIGAQGAKPSYDPLLYRKSQFLFPMSRSITGVGHKDLKWSRCHTVDTYLQMVENELKHTQKLLEEFI